MQKIRLLSIALAASLLSLAAPQVSKADPADPGQGPPDCPGTPGAFISGEAQELVSQGTPPGQVIAGQAREQGVGEIVRSALREECGIGALPPPEDGDG